MSLTWTASTDSVTGYVVDRSATPTFDTVTSTSLGASSTRYEDPLPGGVYYYRVYAVNQAGNSPYATARVSTIAYRDLIDARSSLLAHWRLGETSGATAWDVLGGYNGNYLSSPQLGQAGAVARDSDTAVGFTGTNRVTLPAIPPVQSFTIEGWSRLTSPTIANDTVFGGSASSRLLARPGGSDSATTAYGGVWLGGTEYAVQPKSTDSNVGTWVHWALTRSGSALVLYRNGVNVGQRSDLPATTAADISGYIAAQIGGSYYLSGGIDDVAVYSTALSGQDIANDYTAALNGPTPAPSAAPASSYRDTVLGEPSLIDYWRLGETSGTAAADSKGGATGAYTTGVTLGGAGAVTNDPNGAVAFTAAGQKVTLPALATVGDFSVEAWSYLTNSASNNNPLFAGNGVKFYARPGTSTSATAAYGSVTLGSTEYALQPNSAASNVNTWVHWVLVRRGASLTLYRNAAVIAQRTDLPATTTVSLSGTIAAQGTAYYATGKIDDVALYSAPLSSTAITAHYRAALYGPAPTG